MFDIEEELKKLPEKPGVYLMHDKEDTVIYVGKAIILKNRVRQYFRKNNKTPSHYGKYDRLIPHNGLDQGDTHKAGIAVHGPKPEGNAQVGLILSEKRSEERRVGKECGS